MVHVTCLGTIDRYSILFQLGAGFWGALVFWNHFRPRETALLQGYQILVKSKSTENSETASFLEPLIYVNFFFRDAIESSRRLGFHGAIGAAFSARSTNDGRRVF
jgi:hypothetical protein